MVGYGEFAAVDVGRRRSRESNEGTSFRTRPFCALLAGLARGWWWACCCCDESPATISSRVDCASECYRHVDQMRDMRSF
jgi:hypothetical protein